MATTAPSTLFGRVTTHDGEGASPMLRAASVVLMAGLTAAAAQISVPLPFTQVPFTFQPMVVLLGGLALGPRLGAAAQVLYLLAGVAGLPVFAASATLPQGMLRLLGPTGGYLLSYPFAAFLVGYLAERGFDRRYLTCVLAMLAGLAMIYLGGASMLALVTRQVGVSAAGAFRNALLFGVVPFIAADLVKLLIAAGIVPSLWKLTRAASPDNRR
ncbi:MAG: biotin transporter BioY [Vicinamibacterales bacterium]